MSSASIVARKNALILMGQLCIKHGKSTPEMKAVRLETIRMLGEDIRWSLSFSEWAKKPRRYR